MYKHKIRALYTNNLVVTSKMQSKITRRPPKIISLKCTLFRGGEKVCIYVLNTKKLGGTQLILLHNNHKRGQLPVYTCKIRTIKARMLIYIRERWANFWVPILYLNSYCMCIIFIGPIKYCPNGKVKSLIVLLVAIL